MNGLRWKLMFTGGDAGAYLLRFLSILCVVFAVALFGSGHDTGAGVTFAVLAVICWSTMYYLSKPSPWLQALYGADIRFPTGNPSDGVYCKLVGSAKKVAVYWNTYSSMDRAWKLHVVVDGEIVYTFEDDERQVLHDYLHSLYTAKKYSQTSSKEFVVKAIKGDIVQ